MQAYIALYTPLLKLASFLVVFVHSCLFVNKMSQSGEKFKTFLKSGTFRRKVFKYRSIIPGTNARNRHTVHKIKIKRQTPDNIQSLSSKLFPPTSNQNEYMPESFLDGISQAPEFHGIDLATCEQLIQLSAEHPETARENETLRQCLETISELRAQGCKDQDLGTFLRNWSLEYRISHQALKPLLQKLSEGHAQLPTDPRRLLRTPRSKPEIHKIEGGSYWHHSIGKVNLE